jgi:hypothetical protein
MRVFHVQGAYSRLSQTFRYRRKWYKLEVGSERFHAGPVWDHLAQANPPLSASQALKEAMKFMAKLKQVDGWTHALDRLSLIQPEWQWYWEAQWTRYRYIDGRQKGGDQIRCWILMDGSLVEPVLVRPPKSKAGQGASPNGGPAGPHSNPGAGGGPPSVS